MNVRRHDSKETARKPRPGRTPVKPAENGEARYPPEHLAKALQMIKNCRKGPGRVLDLSGLEMRKLPEKLFGLHRLEELYLNNNRLLELQDGLCCLKGLRILVVSNHSIDQLPADFGDLSRLELLILNAIYLRSLPPSFSALTHLTSLDISSNKMAVFPEPICDLPNLTFLNASDNYFIELPDTLGRLAQLQKLHLGQNWLTRLPFQIGRCGELVELDLTENLLMALPSSIGRLKKLRQLLVGDNRLSHIPSTVGRLAAIDKLDLGHNRLRYVPKQIGDPPLLRHCDLSENPTQPETVHGAFDRKGLVEFLERMWEGRPKIAEARLIMVGDGGMGKTTLKNSLTRGRALNAKFTHGIEIDLWTVEPPADSDKLPVDVDIWDFGGQMIYHQVHQIYLAQRAIYILVFDTRHESGTRKQIKDWLEAIRTFGKDGPVIIVQNQYEHSDLRLGDFFKSLKVDYPNIFGDSIITVRCLADEKSPCQTHGKPPDECGCQTCVHMMELKKTVTEILFADEGARDAEYGLFRMLNWSREKWQAWNELENRATERNCPLMDPDTVGEICRSSGIPREESDRFIEELHDLGHILHSKDVDDLSGQVVLRPEWAKDAIYEVFDSPDIGECNGILSKGVLARIWNDGTDRYPRRSHGYLLDLMEHYELGFPTDDKRNYVFPYFLSRERPAGTVFNEAGTTCIEYEYKRFSHVSLIARFIVRMHNYLARVDAKELCWQTGGILTLADTPEAPDYDGLDQPRALVEYHDEYRKVTVKVTGHRSGRFELLQKIRGCFGEIHARYERIEVVEKARCNCERCLTSNDPDMIPIETLRGWWSKGKLLHDCRKWPHKSFNVATLLFGPLDDPVQAERIESKNPTDTVHQKKGKKIPRNEGYILVRNYIAAHKHDPEAMKVKNIKKGTGGVSEGVISESPAYQAYRQSLDPRNEKKGRKIYPFDEMIESLKRSRNSTDRQEVVDKIFNYFIEIDRQHRAQLHRFAAESKARLVSEVASAWPDVSKDGLPDKDEIILMIISQYIDDTS